MHSIDPFANRPSSARLHATLLQLSRQLEATRQREQTALEAFGQWETQSADQRGVITQRLEWLNRELSQLSPASLPAPHLSLLAFPAAIGEAEEQSLAAEQTDISDEDDDADRKATIVLPTLPWQRN